MSRTAHNSVKDSAEGCQGQRTILSRTAQKAAKDSAQSSPGHRTLMSRTPHTDFLDSAESRDRLVGQCRNPSQMLA